MLRLRKKSQLNHDDEISALEDFGHEPKELIQLHQVYLDVMDQKIENSLSFTVGNSILILTSFIISKDFDGEWVLAPRDYLFFASVAFLIVGIMKKLPLATESVFLQFSKKQYKDIVKEMLALRDQRVRDLRKITRWDIRSMWAIISYMFLWLLGWPPLPASLSDDMARTEDYLRDLLLCLAEFCT